MGVPGFALTSKVQFYVQIAKGSTYRMIFVLTSFQLKTSLGRSMAVLFLTFEQALHDLYCTGLVFVGHSTSRW